MDQWQKLEDGSYICHILALMETSHIDNTFYFDEAQQQWTESDDLGVWIHPDWELAPKERFPLKMLTQLISIPHRVWSAQPYVSKASSWVEHTTASNSTQIPPIDLQCRRELLIGDSTDHLWHGSRITWHHAYPQQMHTRQSRSSSPALNTNSTM